MGDKNQVACVDKVSALTKTGNDQNTGVMTLSVEEKAILINEIKKELVDQQTKTVGLYKKLEILTGSAENNVPLNSEEKAAIERLKEHEKKTKNSYRLNSSCKQNGDKFDLARVGIFEATGSSDIGFGLLVLGKTAQAASVGKDGNDPIAFENLYDSTTNVMNSLKPQDEIEGMLISRMVALHVQSMHYMACAANSDSTNESRDCCINRSTKLSRVYNETLEALSKYRRKGAQHVVVQHVNVNNGGQAVIVGSKGEGDNKKTGVPHGV